MLDFVENSALEDREREEAQRRKEAEARQQKTYITGLAAHVKRAWERNRSASRELHERCIKSLRQRNGEYAPDILSQIESEGGTPIFLTLTDEKCAALEGWIEDILLPSNDKPWTLKPTPVPELSPEALQTIAQQVQQEAIGLLQRGVPVTEKDIVDRVGVVSNRVKMDAERLVRDITNKQEKEVEDKLAEAGFENALRDMLSDFATYPVCFLKGPVWRMRKALVWGQTDEGMSIPVVERKLVPELERVSPLDMYPSPDARTCNDGDLIERHTLTRADLVSMKGVQGYDSDAIDMVLREHASGSLQDWLWINYEQERERLEGRDKSAILGTERIDALQYFGSVMGLRLIEFGIPAEKIQDPLEEYEAEVWLIGNYVIKAELNGDPLGRRPYYKTSFRGKPGSFAGKSLPEVIADIQDVCNAAARNLVDNMGLASGPQVGVDVGLMPEEEEVTTIFPWKVWQFDTKQKQTSGAPIWFFQPNPMTEQLMAVYDKFSEEADNKSGLPRFAYGQGQRDGSLSTATGFSMMMQNAARPVKKAVANLDRDIIAPVVRYFWETLILYGAQHLSRGGDIKIIARGSSYLLAKEQQVIRKNELLQMALNSPVVGQSLGPRVLVLIKEIMDANNVETEGFLPEHELEAIKALPLNTASFGVQQQPVPPNQAPGPGALPETNASGDRGGGADHRVSNGVRAA